MQTTTIASSFTVADTAAPSASAAPSRRTDRVLGIFLIAAVPTIFWTIVIAAIAPPLGYAPTLPQLAKFAVGTAVFLTLIGGAVTERSS